MSTNRTALSAFERPPVVEVAISIMFEPLRGYTAAHAGLLWKRYPDFTIVEEQPELDLPLEEPARPQDAPVPKIAWSVAPKVRTWFRTEAGTQLIQVQRNRFAYNWRRAETSDEYPRYPVVVDRLRSVFSSFLSLFLSTANWVRLFPFSAK